MLSGTVRPFGSGMGSWRSVASETRSLVGRASHHVDQIDVVTNLRYRSAGNDRVEHAGKRLAS